MKQTSPFLRLLAVLFSVALIAAACGDDDSDADDTGTETTQDEGSAADTDATDTDATGSDDTGSDDTGDEASGDAASGDLPDELFSEDCQEAYSAFIGVQAQFGAAFTGQTEGLAEAQADFEAMVDAAPDDVKDAFETFSVEVEKLTDAIADIGLDGESVPTAEQMGELVALADSIDEEAFDQSSDEISAYFDDVCGE